MRGTLVAALLLAATGCATARTPGQSPFSVGPLLPASGPVAHDDLTRPPGSSVRYLVVAGPRSGETLLQRVVDEDGRIRVREERPDGRADEVMHLTRRDDGTLQAHALDKHDDDTRSAFVDSLPLAPLLLEPGSTARGASRLDAFELKTADGPEPHRKASGRCRRELRILGDADVTVRGRTARVAVVEMAFRADLDLARVRATDRLYVERGRGIIAEERSERVLILGVIPRDTDMTIVLEDAGVTAP